ncbi:uncharacterized protein LOC110932821 [Helianthus annuus]|uniref:uncharacterized protein LOC110932821 n=1 Tax=Helianthus annuus TaxID=4232 RepID=UPI000B8F8D30|nr:uncharacterized protein LOC110932821 [Helianthus annuus]
MAALNTDVQDRIVWRTRSGNEVDYCASVVWDDLRQGQAEVPWANVVWFPQSVPHHSFLMWLSVQKKLKTQDIMSRWSSSGKTNFNLMCCSLCTTGLDSHEHLFFECPYATQVWNGIKDKADIGAIPNIWERIYDHLLQFAKFGRAKHIIGKILVGAAAYFVWEERNQRLFSTKKRSADQLVEVILTTVRMKLHTMKFKRTSQANNVLQEWRLPRGLLMDEDDGG